MANRGFRQKIREYRRSPVSAVLYMLVWLSMAITLAVLASLIAYIVYNGVPNLTLPGLFDWEYNSENVSMMPAIINTVIMTGLSLALAVPMGVFAAIYLVEYARRGNRLVKIVRITAETLAGIHL